MMVQMIFYVYLCIYVYVCICMYMYVYIYIYKLMCIHVSDSRSFGATPTGRCDNMFAPEKGIWFPTRHGVKLYIYCHCEYYT